MKKLLLATALATISTASFADEVSNAEVRDVYKTITVQVPHEVKGCHIVDVPIYSQRDGSASEALTGAIIGGVIGHQFGNGSGKDAMTVLGALIGANSQDKKTIVKEYKKEERCTTSTIYGDEKKTVYSHSIMRFKKDGKWYEVEFQK